MKNKHRKVLNVYCWMPSKGFVGRLTKKKIVKLWGWQKKIIYQKLYVVK